MNSEIKKYIFEMELNAPTSMQIFAEVESQLGIKFPQDYVDFMLLSNGCEGIIGDSYLRIWPIEDIIKMNQAYEVDEYVPGLIIFGTNGGGEAFAFDKRTESIKYIMVPFMFDFDDVIELGDSLINFFERLFTGTIFDK